MSHLSTALRLGTLSAAAAVAVVLTACNQHNDGPTAGQQVDSAIAKTEAAVNQVSDKMADAAADAKGAMKTAAADAKDAMQDATTDAQKAAAKAGAGMKAVAADAKADASTVLAKAGNMLGDAGITASVKAELAKDGELSVLAIQVSTKDGVVTLDGPAPSDAAKTRATTITKAVQGVKAVENQLAVKTG